MKEMVRYVSSWLMKRQGCIFFCLTPPRGGVQKYELLRGWGKKMIASPKKRKKGKEKKEKKERERKRKKKKREKKRERKRGKRKEIGKNENKQNFLVDRNHIFSPGGERISYIFLNIKIKVCNFFCVSIQKKIIKNSDRNA